jgi:hypothetical protein
MGALSTACCSFPGLPGNLADIAGIRDRELHPCIDQAAHDRQSSGCAGPAESVRAYYISVVLEHLSAESSKNHSRASEPAGQRTKVKRLGMLPMIEGHDKL